VSGTSAQASEGEWAQDEEVFQTAQNIQKYNPVTAIVPMGTRKVVKEMAYRIQKMAPGGMKLTAAECVVLAQYAISLEANPLVGEVWLMKNQYSGEVLGLAPGIKLFRRKADEQDDKRGDHHYVECYALNMDERKEYLIPDGALAYRAVLRVKSINDDYTKNCAEMNKINGITWEDIRKALGDRPYIEGIGILTLEEMKSLDKNTRNKMPHIERVKKRAEAAALKVHYHLDFGFVQLAAGIDMSATLADDFIDLKATLVPDDQPKGEVSKPDPAASTEFDQSAANVSRMMDEAEGVGKPDLRSPEEQEITKRKSRAAMWPEMETSAGKRKWPPATVAFMVEKYGLKSDYEAKARLDLSPLPFDAPIPEVEKWGDIYQQFRDEGDKPAECGTKASAKYLGIDRPGAAKP
jgi:hypothetical protein